MIFFVVIGCVAGTMLANGHPQSLSDLSYLGKKIYVQPNLWSGERVAEYNPKKDLENPEEMGNYAEGDMVMPEVHGRSVIAWQSSRWPGSIIPYEISGNFDPTELALLQQVINEFHVNTCIRFVPRMNQRDYISIGNTKTGCWSNVGRLGGRQNVNLQSPTCVSKPGTPIHELMHAAGFIHEQSRPDRDEYIEIEWENVQKGFENQFEKSSIPIDTFGFKYDYESIMHYSAYAFTRNGRPTILTRYRTHDAENMGQRITFSPTDVMKLNIMYNCHGKK